MSAECGHTELVTVTEYAARYPSGYVLEFPHPRQALQAAEQRVRMDGAEAVVCRRRTYFADVVTDWEVEPPLDPTNPLDLRVPSFERVSHIDFQDGADLRNPPAGGDGA